MHGSPKAVMLPVAMAASKAGQPDGAGAPESDSGSGAGLATSARRSAVVVGAALGGAAHSRVELMPIGWSQLMEPSGSTEPCTCTLPPPPGSERTSSYIEKPVTLPSAERLPPARRGKKLCSDQPRMALTLTSANSGSLFRRSQEESRSDRGVREQAEGSRQRQRRERRSAGARGRGGKRHAERASGCARHQEKRGAQDERQRARRRVHTMWAAPW